VSLSQLQAESRGWVRIRSADPAAPPAIHYNYLSTENERRTMVEGLKLVRRLASTPPLAGYVAEEVQPGPRVQSDDDWLAFGREAGDTVFHPTSTCRMGEDARAVVDARLRVRGLQALRVIDASILPAVVSGNTNAVVFALAEKGADLVRADASRA
jgi:choline dehydrogenase